MVSIRTFLFYYFFFNQLSPSSSHKAKGLNHANMA
uniref:Uncharacterized protein n=1 Tax=Rhizophora mucronata TaxID=61149 RepID=A0A2P2K9J3_RHIMU